MHLFTPFECRDVTARNRVMVSPMCQYSFDILPALKREDSFVGRRAVRRYPEGNFLTPRGEYRVRALHVGPRNEGMAYSASERDVVSAYAVPDTA